jgi:hypothetical protein
MTAVLQKINLSFTIFSQARPVTGGSSHMSISISPASTPSVAALARTPEASEGPGPDRDGDADDGAVSAVRTPAPPPAGSGLSVDKIA